MQKHSFCQLFLMGVKCGILLGKNVSKQTAQKVHRLRRMKECVLKDSGLYRSPSVLRTLN